MKKSFIYQRGVTLVELIISIVIIAIVVSGIMLLTGELTRRSSDPLILEQANSIARAYIEEINQKQFCDPDWDHDGVPPNTTDCPMHCTVSACTACKTLPGSTGWTTETRATYDDICDFTAITGEVPTNQNGIAVNNLDQYTVSVSIDDGATVSIGTAGNLLTGNTGGAVLVEVTVSHPALTNSVTLSTYRTNF